MDFQISFITFEFKSYKTIKTRITILVNIVYKKITKKKLQNC